MFLICVYCTIRSGKVLSWLDLSDCYSIVYSKSKEDNKLNFMSISCWQGVDMYGISYRWFVLTSH